MNSHLHPAQQTEHGQHVQLFCLSFLSIIPMFSSHMTTILKCCLLFACFLFIVLPEISIAYL